MPTLDDHTIPVEKITHIHALRAVPSASVLVFVMARTTTHDQLQTLAEALADHDIDSLVISEELLMDVRRIPAFELDYLIDICSDARARGVLPGVEEYLWSRKYGSQENRDAMREAASKELRDLGWEQNADGRRADPKPARSDASLDFPLACHRALTRQRLYREHVREADKPPELPDPDEVVNSLLLHPEMAQSVLERLEAALRA